MSGMTIWRFAGDLDWLRGVDGTLDVIAGAHEGEFRASIVFADTNRGELFSTSASAASKFVPHPDWLHVKGTVLLHSDLASYATVGRQFLVVRGSLCEAVGRMTEIYAEVEPEGL